MVRACCHLVGRLETVPSATRVADGGCRTFSGRRYMRHANWRSPRPRADSRRHEAVDADAEPQHEEIKERARQHAQVTQARIVPPRAGFEFEVWRRQRNCRPCRHRVLRPASPASGNDDALHAGGKPQRSCAFHRWRGRWLYGGSDGVEGGAGRGEGDRLARRRASCELRHPLTADIICCDGCRDACCCSLFLMLAFRRLKLMSRRRSRLASDGS